MEWDDFTNNGILYCDFYSGKTGIAMDANFAESLDSNDILKLPQELEFADALQKAIPTKLTIGLTCWKLASVDYQQVLILNSTVLTTFKTCNLKRETGTAISSLPINIQGRVQRCRRNRSPRD